MSAARRQDANEVQLLPGEVIILAATGELHEASVAAEPSELSAEVRKYAGPRILHVVDRVVGQARADRRARPRTLTDGISDVLGDIAADGRIGPCANHSRVPKTVTLLDKIIGEVCAQCLGDRQAEANSAAGRLRVL